MIKLAVIMDPIETTNLSKDSTVAILFEAARRGWLLYYLQQKDLLLRDGKVLAHTQALHLFEKNEKWFQLGEKETLALSAFDFVFMRKDPPVDSNYIYATQLLDIAEKQGAVVFNRPSSLRDANEKIFATWFPHCCPPTLITAHIHEIKTFLAEEKEIVVKPLYGMGGEGIFRITPQELNLNVILETLTKKETCMIIAQRYLPEIKAGDKRVLMIDGYPIEYALARIPPPGETRGNLAVGGKGVAMLLSKREKWLCEQVGPVLREKGLIFVGLDIIGDYITEINVTSPTCIRELEKETPLKISQQFLDVLERFF
jgi:glutathione synthase